MTTKQLAAVLVALVPLSLLLPGYWFMKNVETIPIPSRVNIAISDNNFPLNTGRYVIYQCLNGQNCGGLSDRQDGMISAYIISQILGVRFGIDVDKPCPLVNYLVPNHVNWTIPANALNNKTKEYWNYLWKKNYNEFTFENITMKKTKDVIYYRSCINIQDFLMKNPLYNKLPWTRGLSRYDAFKNIYNLLFKLSTATQNKLDSFLNSVGEDRLVCAHIRTGRNERYPFPTPHVPTVIDFLKRLVKHERSYKIFLAADSQQVLPLFNRTFGSHLSHIPGHISHIDKPRENPECDGIEKAILDQIVLTYCDTLVMSRSGFSRTAALLRGSDDNLYEVEHKNVTKVMRMETSVKNKNLHGILVNLAE